MAAKDKNGAENQNPPTPQEGTEKTKRVRIICKGVLGHKGFKQGDITDDPEYVALLKVKGQKKVEEVK